MQMQATINYFFETSIIFCFSTVFKHIFPSTYSDGIVSSIFRYFHFQRRQFLSATFSCWTTNQLLDANSSNNKICSEENVNSRYQLLDANASNDKTCSEENVSSQTKISSDEDGVYLCEICELRMNDYTDFFNHLSGHPGKNPIII
jgi:hypothetical protein